MSTPAEDKGPSLQDAAKQIAQSITDAFSGLFDYEGHSNRDRNYRQKGPGPEDTETWKHKYERAIEARDDARRERDEHALQVQDLTAQLAAANHRIEEFIADNEQWHKVAGEARRDRNELRDYLDKIRGPIVETDIQASARQYLRDMYVDPTRSYADQGQQGRAVLTVLDDIQMWKDAYVESLERKTQVEAERDRWKSEHANATRLLNEQSEAVRKSQPKPLGLTDQLARLDKVITDQVEAVGSGSTLSKAANIRRLQVRDFDSEHDRTHGWALLSQAAHALLMRAEHEWPWDDVTRYRKLAALPLSDRCAHAAALICAAGDVAKAEGM